MTDTSILQHCLTAVGCLLAICSMIAAAHKVAAMSMIVFSGPAMILLIFGYGGTTPFTAVHVPVNDFMIGIVFAATFIHMLQQWRSAPEKPNIEKDRP